MKKVGTLCILNPSLRFEETQLIKRGTWQHAENLLRKLKAGGGFTRGYLRPRSSPAQ